MISFVGRFDYRSETSPRISIRATVGYALLDVNKPIRVSTYLLEDVLAESLQGELPKIEELETQLNIVNVEIEDGISIEAIFGIAA